MNSDDAAGGGGGYHGHQSSRRGPTNYNNSNQPRFQQGKFGYSDFRTNQQNYVYPGASNNFYQRGGQQGDVYNQSSGNQTRGGYNRSQPVMSTSSVPQNRSMSNFSPAYYSQYNQNPPSMQSFNPTSMQTMNGQNPYGQQPAYNGGYYDPYVAAYMTQQGSSVMGNGLESQNAYGQGMPLQQQWMVPNASPQVSVPMHQTAIAPAESDRSQPMNNYMPRAEYGANRQMGGRSQNRNYQSHAGSEGYSAYSSRQYQNSNGFNGASYGYGQQRGDFRSRDGYHVQQQQQQQMRFQDQYRQSNYQAHHQAIESNDEVAVESVEEVQEQVIDETIHYQSSEQNEVPSVNP